MGPSPWPQPPHRRGPGRPGEWGVRPSATHGTGELPWGGKAPFPLEVHLVPASHEALPLANQGWCGREKRRMQRLDPKGNRLCCAYG